MYIIFNRIDEGAVGIAPYISFSEYADEAEESFLQANEFIQYGEHLYLYELPDYTIQTLDEDTLVTGIDTMWSNVDTARELNSQHYGFSEEITESYTR